VYRQFPAPDFNRLVVMLPRHMVIPRHMVRSLLLMFVPSNLEQTENNYQSLTRKLLLLFFIHPRGTPEFNSTTFLIALGGVAQGARSLAQAIFRWTRLTRPQRVPAMTFSRPATSANVHGVHGQVLQQHGVWLLTKNDVELSDFRNSRNVKVCKVGDAGDGQVGEVADP